MHIANHIGPRFLKKYYTLIKFGFVSLHEKLLANFDLVHITPTLPEAVTKLINYLKE